MKPWVTVLGCVVFAGNILCLIFWFSIDRLHAVGPNRQPIASYDAISLQISILSLVVTAVGIGLAVASIFGYQALRDAVLARADKLVNERMNERLKETAHPRVWSAADRMQSSIQGPIQGPIPDGDIQQEDQKL